ISKLLQAMMGRIYFSQRREHTWQEQQKHLNRSDQISCGLHSIRTYKKLAKLSGLTREEFIALFQLFKIQAKPHALWRCAVYGFACKMTAMSANLTKR
ncbi:MAG: hypothetical protein EBQ68_04070, partial [Betaproteobacteria bacterium]|nr:hypothetical protein [Betaproteobacteria bacterium]